MKSLLLTFLFIFSSLFSFSQSDYLLSNIEKATAVVEGKVYKKESFRSENGLILTANYIRVYTTFKGNACDSIIIITKGGDLDNRSLDVSHTLQLFIGEHAIFLLSPHKTVNYLAGCNAYIPYNNYAGKISKLLNDKENEAFYFSNSEFIKSWRKLKISIGYITGIDARIKPVKSQLQLKKLTSATELCLKFDNAQIINPYQVSVDLMAKSSVPGLSFSQAYVLVNYPTEHLGNNVVANGGVEASRGDIIENSDQYELITKDEAVDQMSIEIESDCLGSDDYYVLDTTYEKLANLIFDVESWGNTGTVNLESFAFEGYAKHFLADDDGCVNFDNLCVSNPITLEGCEINNIQVQPTSAGTSKKVTISGEGFGQGILGFVFIPDADNGGQTRSGYGFSQNYEYIEKWNDSTIIVKVSSIGGNNGTMGSGPWQVDPQTGIPCTETVEIDYSLLNKQIEITEDSLVDKAIGFVVDSFGNAANSTGIVEWYIDSSSINNNPLLVSQGITVDTFRQIAEAAFCDWETLVNLDFEYKGLVATGILDDDISVITFVDSIENKDSGERTLAETSNWSSKELCSPDNYFTGLQATFDMQFNSSVDWYIGIAPPPGGIIPDSTTDIYSILIHEIGHALLLRHAMDTNGSNGTDDDRIMFYNAPEGKTKRIIDGKSLAGVQFNLDETVIEIEIENGCFGSYVLDRDINGCGLNHTHEQETKIHKNVLLSNIVSKNQGRLELLNSKIDNIYIFDIGGKPTSYNRENRNIITLETNLSNGMYLFQYTLDNKAYVEKFIIL